MCPDRPSKRGILSLWIPWSRNFVTEVIEIAMLKVVMSKILSRRILRLVLRSAENSLKLGVAFEALKRNREKTSTSHPASI